MMFVEDNNGHFPSENIVDSSTWFANALSPYGGSRELYMCSDAMTRDEIGFDIRCYSLNTYLMGYIWPGKSGFPRESALIDNVARPDETIMTMECYSEKTTPENPRYGGRWNNAGQSLAWVSFNWSLQNRPSRPGVTIGKMRFHSEVDCETNFSFVDGHVSFMNYNDTFEPIPASKGKPIMMYNNNEASSHMTTFSYWDYK